MRAQPSFIMEGGKGEAVSEERREKLSPDALICGAVIRLMALGSNKSRWSVIFVGAKPDYYLIVEPPRLNGAAVKHEEGSVWSANFIRRGVLYTFETEVLGHTWRPAPLMFLRYPAEVQAVNLRSEKRYPVQIPLVAEIIRPPAAEEGEDAAEMGLIKALAVDISEHGFLMASPLALARETYLSANFYLPKDEVLSGVQALVRDCHSRSGGHFVGLSYDPSNPPEVQARLKNLIDGIENMPLRL